ncbi:FHA domain-containing protein [Candidatus Latescibacterota bacterium]
MEEDWNIVLSVLESPDPTQVGLQKVFTTSPVKIGRADDNDFIVSDPTVSRNHTSLRITNDYSRVFITDSSTHGTIVSEKQVPKGLGSGFTIRTGDSIKIGSTLLRFELNLKQSVQSTFIGKVDRSFLDVPPEVKEEEVGAAPEEEEAAPVFTAEKTEKTSNVSLLSIIIIILCVLILVYLIFFQ